MLRMTNEKNPSVQWDFKTYTNMMRFNPTEAEEYRKRTTGEIKVELPASTNRPRESGKTIQERSQEVLNAPTVEKEKVLKNQVIDIDRVKQALIDKGVKGANLLKNEEKIMEKARENNIL